MPVKEDLLQVQEVTVMKFSAISFAIVFAGFAGIVSAGQPNRTLSPVDVSSSPLSECAPPNDTAGHACDAFNQLVRANFSAREIGMLFGHATSYPEYRTGGIARLQRRYQAVVREYMASLQQAGNADIAVK